MAASTAAQCLGPLGRFLPHARFTKVQEEVIPAVFTDSRNCLVAAPTGSGKTVLLEVAMLRLFRGRLGERGLEEWVDTSAFPCTGASPPKQKAVYICPIKALANEKFTHWRAQFPSLTVVIETGDQRPESQLDRAQTPPPPRDGNCDGDAARMVSVAEADILVTTPERWDSITRRWKEKEVMAIVNSVGLLMLDEVHTVQEERGAAMEAIVSRVKVIQTSSVPAGAAGAATAPVCGRGAAAAVTRIVAVSGTLPNCRDLAEWLHVPPDMVFTFAPQDRPVPLTVRVVSYPHDSSNPFAFHRFLSFKLFALMQQYSEGKPTLVFCASRKEATSTAQRLVDDIRDAAARQGQTAQLQPSTEAQQLARQAADRQLRGCLLVGVGFHHAAMTRGDRELVERMFREQYIAVICATTTLALGVNLPAHLVIIKGTAQFAKGQCQDMPVSEVMQMCGRAGRPGFDTHGVALVLTTQRSARLYDTVSSGAAAMTCVESHLHRHMIEHVNAEVALRTIHSFATAMEWLRTTFFWIRLRKCPRHYGLEFANHAEEAAFNADAFAEALMERVLRVLVEEGCVALHRVAPDAGGAHGPSDVDDIPHPSAAFEATRLGRAMSRLYILFDTVCVLNAKLKERSRPLARCGGGDDAEAAEADGNNDAEDADEDEGAAASTGLTTARAAEDSCDNAKGGVGGAPPLTRSARRITPFTLRDALQLLCHCQELVEVNLRQGDRGPLNELNKAIRYPLHSGRRGGREVREDWQKVYVLVQAHIGLLPLTEVSLRNDSLRLWAVVPRVARFLVEYAWVATTSYTLALHAHVLARAAERRVWPDGLVLRQLHHVSDAVAKALLRSGVQSFDSLAAVDARQLEVLCSRLPPFGSQVMEEVRQLPRVHLSVKLASGLASRRYGTVELSVRSLLAAKTDPRVDAAGADANVDATVARFLLVVGIPSEDTVLLKRVVTLSALAASLSGVLTFQFCLPPATASPAARDIRVEARCLAERFMGLDAVAVVAEQPRCEPPPPSASTSSSQALPIRESEARQADLAMQVAAEARRTFGELMADFTYVQSTAAESEERPAVGATSRKRTRSNVKVPDAVAPQHDEVDCDGESARGPERPETPVPPLGGATVLPPSAADASPAATRPQKPTAEAEAAGAAVAYPGQPPTPSQAASCKGGVVDFKASSSPYPSASARHEPEVPTPATLSMDSASPARRHRTMVRLQPCPSPPAARPVDTLRDAAAVEELHVAPAAPSGPLRATSRWPAPPPPPLPQSGPPSVPFTDTLLMYSPQQYAGPGGERVAVHAMPATHEAPQPPQWRGPRQSRFTVHASRNGYPPRCAPTPPHAYACAELPVYGQRPAGPPHAPHLARGEGWWPDAAREAGWAIPRAAAPAQQAPWADGRVFYERAPTYVPAAPSYTEPLQPFPCNAAMLARAPPSRYPAYPPCSTRDVVWPQSTWGGSPQELPYYDLGQQQRGGLRAPPGLRGTVCGDRPLLASPCAPLDTAAHPSHAATPPPRGSCVVAEEWGVLTARCPPRAATYGSRPPTPQGSSARQATAPRYDGFAPHARRSSMVPQSWWQ